MRKRILALILVLSLCAAQAAYASALTMAGFDGEGSNHIWSDNGFFKRMEARTGLTFTFDQYTSLENWQKAKDDMFTSGTLPDVLFKAALGIDEQIRYSDSGQLIDLLPLLEDNAPNLWALLQENPEWLAAITLPSGKVVALPTINPLPMQNAMWINQDWLDALKLEQPTDWASFVDVLAAFQTKDPNQNGKQDEIPLSFLGPWDLKFLAHAFGLVANDYNIYADEAGTVQFLPLQDSFVDFLKALVPLYEQGLLDKDGFTNADALRTVTDTKATVTYGVFFGPNPYHLFPIELGSQYSLLEPLVDNGSQVYRDLFGPISVGSFAITSACPNPEEMLGWVDYLYTEEGARTAMAGAEGEDYVWKEDGSWEYAADIAANSSYILYDLSIYDTGNMPWLSPVDFYTVYDVENLRTVTGGLLKLQNVAVSPFPYYYVLSAEQSAAIAPLQNALGVYVDEHIAKFVLGELDINSAEDVSAFRDGLAGLGLQEFLSFWQEIYDTQRIR